MWFGSILFAVISVAVKISSSDVLHIYPSDVELLTNSRMMLSCTLSGSTRSYVDEFTWKFVCVNSSEVVISETFAIMVNTSTSVLEYPSIRSIYDGCSISCSAANLVAEAKISVKDKHPRLRIQNFEVTNWEELRFNWSWTSPIDSARMLHMNLKAWYKNSISSEYTECKIYAGECRVKDPFNIATSDGVMHLMVNGSNKLENISNISAMIQLNNYVRPGRVKKVNVQPNHENFSVIHVVFQPPNRKSITYNLLTICNNGLFTMTNTITPIDEAQINTSIMVKVTGVPEDSNCMISIKGRPSGGDLWGPAADFNFQTPEAVPLSAPEICRNCFERQLKEFNQTDVIIYFKPLSRVMARGRITEYKVQYVDSHSRKIETINFTSKSPPYMHRIKNLSPLDEYRFHVEARTAVGYNDSLQVPLILVSRVPFKIERFVVILKNDTNVVASWLKQEHATSYMLFWCKRITIQADCLDVVNWMEVSSDCNSSDIVLKFGDDSNNYMFGIAASDDNSRSTGIQWNDQPYSFSGFCPSPDFELNFSTESEIFLHFKRPPFLRGNSFIAKYVIYFCKISSEKDHVCSDQMKNLTVDGWTEDVNISDLDSGQMYLIIGQSWTDSGRSSENKTRTISTDASNEIAKGYIALIVVACLVVAVLLAAGLYTLFRFSRTSVFKYREWINVHITIPKGKSVNTEVLAYDTREMKDDDRPYAEANKEYAKEGDTDTIDNYNIVKNDADGLQIDISHLTGDGNHVNVPLISEKRFLPPIHNIAGSVNSGPSVVIHKSPESARILPSIQRQPAYVKPIKRDRDVPFVSETVSMVTATENHDDQDEPEDCSSYAYVRQHTRPSEFQPVPLSRALPIKFDDGKSGIHEYDDDDDDGKIIDQSSLAKKTMNSFEHLPSLR